MKVLILAGGYGTRLSELTSTMPKPLVDVNGKPLLLYIMEHYARHGFNDFIIACGYRGEKIREYFSKNFSMDRSSEHGAEDAPITFTNSNGPKWRVTLVDTGLDTLTGGRIKRCAKYLDGDEFMYTYGDGVSDVDLKKLLEFHHRYGQMATICAVRMPRFGVVQLDNAGKVTSFQEKRLEHSPLINGGFMVLNKSVLDYIEGDKTAFETTPMQILSEKGELYAYRHDGFWKCVDSLRDKMELEEILKDGSPWKD